MKTQKIFFYFLLLFSAAILLPGCGGGGGSGDISSGSSSTLTLDASVRIPDSCQGKTITAYPTAADIAAFTTGVQANAVISPEDQLALFDEVAQIVTDDYVDPAYNGVNWPNVVTEYRTKVEGGLETEAFYALMKDFIKELGDDHSKINSPAEVEEENARLAGTNNYVGYGLLVLPMSDKGTITVLSVYHDSPAEHGGLAQHDIIQSVNGFPVVENGKPYPERLRGPECSGAVLTVQSPGGVPRDITMVRDHISGGLPVNEQLVSTTDGSHIGYIFIPTFFDNTIPNQVKSALGNLGTLDGLIIDNRMNGGGSSTVMNSILGYFTSGIVGYFVNQSGTRPLDIASDPVGDSQTVPLMVLVGEDTVSYGEVSSGILQDVGRAQIVGKTTKGNVETLWGYNLFDGSQLWLAYETFDPINSDEDWEQTGIAPTVEAYADWDTFTFENDPAVAAAVVAMGH